MKPAAQSAKALSRDRRPALATLGTIAAFAAVAAATLYLSFNAGGFFVAAPAFVAVALIAGLVLHVALAQRPFAGIGPLAGVAIGAMALYSVWTLLSATWSHAPARALVEFDRSLLYTATLVLASSFGARHGRLRAMLVGLATAVVVVAAVGLTTRVLPHVWPLAPNVSQDRLSYPLTYWNALGLLVAAGIVAVLHFAAETRESVAVRVLATAALPMLAVTLYFTLSRASIAVGVAGVLLYLALARPRGSLPALAAALPGSVAAVLAAYHADALTSDRPTSAAAVVQGHRTVLVVAGAILAAALLRILLVPLERRLRAPRVRLPVPLWTVGLAFLAALALAAVASGVARRAIDNFDNSDAVSNLSDQRSRLLSVSNNGRFDHWRVAIDAFAARPLEGAGAGTYQNLWAQHRESNFTVVNAHSLYLGALAELGVVGLLLLLTALVAIVVALVRRTRGPDRAVATGALACVAMWLVAAGVDWDWEMPAVTLWVFALGGMALAVDGEVAAAAVRWPQGSRRRLVLGLGCLVLGVTPVLLALSQIHLDRAASAFYAGDCNRAIDQSLASISALSVRPEPYEVIGLCDARDGQGALGVSMLQRAVQRDRNDWEYWYALALGEAASGRDPRVAARRSHELNPLEPRTRYALELYDHGDPAQWRARAYAAPLPP